MEVSFNIEKNINKITFLRNKERKFSPCILNIPGWYRGFCTKNRSAWGIFPSTVVSLRPCTVKGTGASAIAEPTDDPLVREIAVVLREWARLWKKLYVVKCLLIMVW